MGESAPPSRGAHDKVRAALEELQALKDADALPQDWWTRAQMMNLEKVERWLAEAAGVD